MGRMLRRASAVVVGVAIVVAGQAAAFAARPSNDTEANAVVLTGVPFAHAVDTTDAIANGPTFCGNLASVFYRFTPSVNVRIQADTLGSDYDTTLGIYTRSPDEGLQEIGCSDDRIGSASGLRFRASAGTTYYFIVGACCGRSSPTDRDATDGGGPLTFSVTRVSFDALGVDVAVRSQGTVDASTGMATIGATITCTKRSVVYFEGVLRQLRQSLFVARAYVWAEVDCTPDRPIEWSDEFDTDTSVAFGSGAATVRITYVSAWAGWGSGMDRDDEIVSNVVLA